MTGPVSLPPSYSEPWETAQSLTSAARRPLPADIIRSMWNPAACPAGLLPWLAWGLGLEIWKDEWTEEKKHEIIARIWLLKRRKTTLRGIADYVELAGGAVVKAVRPRDKRWRVPSMTPAERQDFMARMPEIRIFPSPLPASAGPAQGFHGREFHNYFARFPSDAARRWRDRAVYVADGAATRVTVTGLDRALDESYTIALRASSPAKKFHDQFGWRRFRAPSDAAEHVVSISPNGGALSFAVPRGLVPVSVRPPPAAERTPAPVYKALHYPSFHNFSCRIPSDARTHIYDSLRLLDPSKSSRRGRPMSFWGWSPSAAASFSARLTLRVPLTRPIWARGRWRGAGFWRKSVMSPLWDCLEAVTLAQAARDDIWVSTQLYRKVELSGGLRFGAFDFGDWRKVV